jgi:hypothetical protein
MSHGIGNKTMAVLFNKKERIEGNLQTSYHREL